MFFSSLRVLGLVPLVKTNITVPWKVDVHSQLNWTAALNPVVLLALYYTLVIMLRQWSLPAKVWGESSFLGLHLPHATIPKYKRDEPDH